MSRRTTWRSGFLAITALAIGMELFASFDGNDDTEPWTELVIGYLPWEVTTAAVGALLLWLPAHFGYRYYRKHRPPPEPS